MRFDLEKYAKECDEEPICLYLPSTLARMVFAKAKEVLLAEVLELMEQELADYAPHNAVDPVEGYYLNLEAKITKLGAR
jgi:hypothetical protein